MLLLAALALATVSAGTDVSVCRDATYTLPVSRGAICSGSGSAPAGSACPLKGDVATADCYSYLPSYNGSQCIVKEDGVCTYVNGYVWGCVFPSVGCTQSDMMNKALPNTSVTTTPGAMPNKATGPCPM
ncbi:uncharacterized protein PHALS_10818 [Plasmopara halstedii]|uniref:RxLR-like protein n=1 Tax=Plasmopara halstedii TaxID=4781 RepID=A0A0P1AHB7_PLAHL|nr:uncharacterized protein PHALS_10818 [Plasmopara halstedii]CEG40632.1 hypothetical protein PHALS_10818 [Plasmopara halstedii]|eukprot:XP_024577001.1 hypothetical protein PHALS_10818 [Plasmopara halstedii]